MKAIVQHAFGNADVLTYSNVEIPARHEGECLIKVAYASVNYADIKMRSGTKGDGSFPFSLGLDLSGIIEQTDPNSSFKVGDRVIAFAKYGTYSEYAVANESLIFKIPDTVPLDKAAAMPTVTILAYMLLHEIGNVQQSDTIVIHSAAGGVGSMLVQLAKLAGVKKIIATVGNKSKASYVKALGAHDVATYDTFTQLVLEQTNNEGANVIFDSVAGAISKKSLDCLALYGTLVQFGNSSGETACFKSSDVHASCRNIKGFSLGTTRKHAPHRLAPVAKKVLDLFENQSISLPIASIFPLHEAKQAHELMESRAYEGKIVLSISPNL